MTKVVLKYLYDNRNFVFDKNLILTKKQEFCSLVKEFKTQNKSFTVIEKGSWYL